MSNKLLSDEKGKANCPTPSEELEQLKSINPKTIKAALRYTHFGKIAELEAELAVAEKLKKLRKKLNPETKTARSQA